MSLIELLLTTTLGLILLSSVSALLLSIIKHYEQQQVRHMMLNQASIITQQWEKTLGNSGDLGCYAPENFNQIENHTDYKPLTNNGIQIYQTNEALPEHFPEKIYKKLLPGSNILSTEGMMSPPIHILYSEENKNFFSINLLPMKNKDLVILSNCQKAWLFFLNTLNENHFKADFIHATENETYQFALWKTIFWFVMKNNQNTYGLYRLILPDETTPVELLSNVSYFNARVYPGDYPKSLWINLGLSKNQENLYWSVIIGLTRHANLWRTI